MEAVVLGVNRDEQEISVGVRPLKPDPWDETEHRYVISKQVKGTVRNITAADAFVELAEGIGGLVHVSDVNCPRKINHPSEMRKEGDEVEAFIIEIDKNAQRISLSLEQL